MSGSYHMINLLAMIAKQQTTQSFLFFLTAVEAGRVPDSKLPACCMQVSL